MWHVAGTAGGEWSVLINDGERLVAVVTGDGEPWQEPYPPMERAKMIVEAVNALARSANGDPCLGRKLGVY